MGAIKITKVTDYIRDYYILSDEGKSWYGIWCLSVQDACLAVVCDLHGYQARFKEFGDVSLSSTLKVYKVFTKFGRGPCIKRILCLGPASVINFIPLSMLSF